MEENQIKQIIEAALLASDGPLTVANLTKLFAPGELNEDTATKDVRAAIKSIEEIFEGLDVFNTLELTNTTSDIFSFNFVNS